MTQVLNSAIGHFREIGRDEETGEMRAVFIFHDMPPWPLGLAWAPLVRLQPTIISEAAQETAPNAD